MIRIFAVILAASLLSGCAAVTAIVGGVAAGSFGVSALGSAGGVIGGEIAKNEVAWFKQWQACRHQFRTHNERVACMERYRASLYGARVGQTQSVRYKR